MNAYNRNFIEDPPEDYWPSRPVVDTFRITESDGPFFDTDDRKLGIHSLRRDRCYQSKAGRPFRVAHEIRDRHNKLSIEGVNVQ